jgi:hypothetical protein
MSDSDESNYYSDEDQFNYEKTVWLAFNNIQHYIIKTATKFDDNTMFDTYTELNHFKSQPENKKYVSEINRLIKKFNIKKYEHHLEKLCKINNGYCFPSIIEMDELWDACVGIEHIYNNINIIYDTYEEVYKHFNQN